MTNVTCRLTAKRPGSAPCPMLVIEYETTFCTIPDPISRSTGRHLFGFMPSVYSIKTWGPGWTGNLITTERSGSSLLCTLLSSSHRKFRIVEYVSKVWGLTDSGKWMEPWNIGCEVGRFLVYISWFQFIWNDSAKWSAVFSRWCSSFL